MSITCLKCFVRTGLQLVLILLLAACGSSSRPPVDELGGSQRFLDADKMHRVNDGETLYVIAWMYDLDFAALASANDLREPYNLNPGQMLRVGLRNAQAATAAASAPAATTTATGVIVTPVQIGGGISRVQLGNSGLQRTTLPESPATRLPPSIPATTPQPPLATPEPVIEAPSVAVAPEVPVELPPEPARQPASSGPIQWAWPAQGQIIGRFSDAGVEGKGVDIAGSRGDPVKAAADGQVVYAGSGLLRYGDLIIIKHDERFLSAYAHNDKILVKEGATVKRGDTIAELGSSGIDKTMLHFEIRVQGTPEDPMQYLPAR
jgi:lipoprotein NlpD